MYQQVTTEAHSLNKTKKSKQSLIRWDVENGEVEKTKFFLLVMVPYEVLWLSKLLLVSVKISQVEMTDVLIICFTMTFS